MPSLLQISIGPVQEFIASARRSRDLWFGSWLLSEIAKAAALQIVGEATGVAKPDITLGLIFPAPTLTGALERNTTFSAPNKLVALIEQPAAEVAQRARSAARKRLREIRDDAFDAVAQATTGGAGFLRSMADDQVDDLLEFAWVAVPITSASGYPAARQEAERLLGARKSTRLFNPVSWGAHAPKSSLDGQRESVIPDEVYGQYDAAQLYAHYRVRRGERLCGVGLLKRHGRRGTGEDRFFSTSHVAALPLLSRFRRDERDLVLQGKQLAAREAYFAHLRDIAGVPAQAFNQVPGQPNGAFERHDGHFLFEERLGDYITDKAKLLTARAALRTFLDAALGGERPSPYYALLHADGDRMGEAIDALDEHPRHRELSQALDRFAGLAGEIVGKWHGSLVYAGGDDVLAFVPLDTALECARNLADAFAARLADFAFVSSDKRRRAPTLSVGLAIAHHLEPLADALNLVRGAERIAKAQREKNALAVTLSKRSGADRTVAGGWQDKVSLGALDERLTQFATFHVQNAIPDGFAYELASLQRRLATSEDALAARLGAPLRAEAIRILDRKRDQSGTKVSAAIRDQLVALLQEATLRPDPAAGKPSLGQIADELIIARIFADAKRQAV